MTHVGDVYLFCNTTFLSNEVIHSDLPGAFQVIYLFPPITFL